MDKNNNNNYSLNTKDKMKRDLRLFLYQSMDRAEKFFKNDIAQKYINYTQRKDDYLKWFDKESHFVWGDKETELKKNVRNLVSSFSSAISNCDYATPQRMFDFLKNTIYHQPLTALKFDNNEFDSNGQNKRVSSIYRKPTGLIVNNSALMWTTTATYDIATKMLVPTKCPDDYKNEGYAYLYDENDSTWKCFSSTQVINTTEEYSKNFSYSIKTINVFDSSRTDGTQYLYRIGFVHYIPQDFYKNYKLIEAKDVDKDVIHLDLVEDNIRSITNNGYVGLLYQPLLEPHTVSLNAWSKADVSGELPTWGTECKTCDIVDENPICGPAFKVPMIPRRVQFVIPSGFEKQYLDSLHACGIKRNDIDVIEDCEYDGETTISIKGYDAYMLPHMSFENLNDYKETTAEDNEDGEPIIHFDNIDADHIKYLLTDNGIPTSAFTINPNNEEVYIDPKYSMQIELLLNQYFNAPLGWFEKLFPEYDEEGEDANRPIDDSNQRL